MKIFRPSDAIVEGIARAARASVPCVDSWALSCSPERVAEILNALFVASLRDEEGVSVRPRCVDIPRRVAFEGMRFDEHVALNPDVLVKLSPALSTSALAIELRYPRICAWGLCYGTPINGISYTVIGPGSLVVQKSSQILATILEGEPRSHDQGLTRLRVEQVVSRVFGTGDFPDRLGRSIVLMDIVTEIRRMRRGGCLLLLPDEGVSETDLRIDLGRRPNAKTIPETFQEILAARERIRQWDPDTGEHRADPGAAQMYALFAAMPQTLRDVLRREAVRLAGLAAIDGAIVLNEDLTLVAFGAKIAVADGENSLLAMSLLAAGDGPSEIGVSSLGGTRHQSAARFVAAHHDSFAVVVSQDGRVTLFAWLIEKERVIALRDIEHYLSSGPAAAI